MSPLAAIFYREVKIRSTNITFLFFDLFYPLLYLLVFGVGVNAALGAPSLGAGIDYNSFFLAGVLGMASFGIATTSSWSFFLDRDNGIFYEMLTYPMRRSEYLLGKVLFNVCVGVVQAAITVGLGCWLLKIHLQWNLVPILAALVIGGAAGWFFFYSIFALKIRRNDVFNSVVNVSYFVFLFASSMFYPLEPLPKWFRGAALANPITWQVDLMRYGSIGAGEAHRLWLEAAGFAIFAVVSFAYAVRSLREQG
ncbi:MAG TPA: ABC transporter permease [Candidatus Acidoferrales bacterium]|nr:ABC transporter permease [Candidatus Acidoferrales bacterium]